MKVMKTESVNKDAAGPRESLVCVGMRVAMPALVKLRSSCEVVA